MTAMAKLVTIKQQLADFFSPDSRDKGWKIGLELEFFIVDGETLLPIPYDGERGIGALLREMARLYSWSPVLEAEEWVGLEKGNLRITLEPGGQIELSGSPRTFVADCIAERNEFVDELREVLKPRGLELMAMGYHPLGSLADSPWVPKERYHLMADYFSRSGGRLAHHMMKLTTSVQVCIDYVSEQDFSEKIALATFLTPLLSAVFANSPFKRGEFAGSLDFRGVCWENTDTDRCGLLEEALSGEFGFDDYVEYLLSVPMIVRYENERAIPMHGLPFRDYMSGHGASIEDWASHVTFAFPETRLRQYIELRMCDAVNFDLLPAVPALVKGLFYNPDTRKELADFFREFTPAQVVSAYSLVHAKALHAEMGGRPVMELAKEIVTFAEQGLVGLTRTGFSTAQEVAFLDPVKELLWDKQCSPGEETMSCWEAHHRNFKAVRDMMLL